MQFKVPQFLEIEDKIFGPFTFRQFIYLVGGGGLCFILYRLLGFWLGAVPIVLIAAFSFALAFYRPNDKPFIFMLQSAMKYVMQSKLYIWKRKQIKAKKKAEEPAPSQTFQRNDRLTEGRLRDLAWSLDVLDLSKHKGD